VCIILFGTATRTERPVGQSLLENKLQVDLRYDATGQYLNRTSSSGFNCGVGKEYHEIFEDFLCFEFNGKKLFYRPRPSVMITLHIVCKYTSPAKSKSGKPERTLELNFGEGIVEDEYQAPTPVVSVQYGLYMDQAGGTGEELAGDATGWVIGGPVGIPYHEWEGLQDAPAAFFNSDFRQKPPTIWLCGVLVQGEKDCQFGKKKMTTETANFARVQKEVSKQGQLWFAEELKPDSPEQERGIVVAGLQAANSAATVGLEDVRRKKMIMANTTQNRGKTTTLGKCGNADGIASCLNSKYVCKITKIEYDENAHTVILHFVSGGDGSDGYLSDGKDPKKSELYWEGHGGSAKPTSVQTSEHNIQGKIVGRMTFKNVPRDAKSVQFRYGSPSCCKQHTQSYSKADIDLNNLPGASVRSCHPMFFYVLFTIVSSALMTAMRTP